MRRLLRAVTPHIGEAGTRPQRSADRAGAGASGRGRAAPEPARCRRRRVPAVSELATAIAAASGRAPGARSLRYCRLPAGWAADPRPQRSGGRAAVGATR